MSAQRPFRIQLNIWNQLGLWKLQILKRFQNEIKSSFENELLRKRKSKKKKSELIQYRRRCYTENNEKSCSSAHMWNSQVVECQMCHWVIIWSPALVKPVKTKKNFNFLSCTAGSLKLNLRDALFSLQKLSPTEQSSLKNVKETNSKPNYTLLASFQRFTIGATAPSSLQSTLQEGNVNVGGVDIFDVSAYFFFLVGFGKKKRQLCQSKWRMLSAMRLR